MASRQLGFPRTSSCSLKEQLVRRTLHNVRSQGHTYVELREDGKRLVFFCTLCHSPCYSDSVLFNHLRGSLHTEMVAAAKATLLKPNPWPFNDGVLFFNDLNQDKHGPIVNTDERRLAILQYLTPAGVVQDDYCLLDSHLPGNGMSNSLVIPGVLCKNELSDLQVMHIGIGRIAARLTERSTVSNGIRRIWCEWLGNTDSEDIDVSAVPHHEFSVVTFPYNFNLGRKALADRFLLPSSPYSESEEIGVAGNKKRKSFSDPEDSMINQQCDSSGEESQSTNNSNMRLLLGTCDDQLLSSRIISSKTVRRELRKQQRVASERMCDICQQKMLPGKDVATLLNRESGRLVCSSRNLTGAFHVFHVSCLIHWILLCELETYGKPFDRPRVETNSKRRSKRKINAKEKKDEIEAVKQIYSVFCPECQGTGLSIKGDNLEKPTVPLSEMFRYKIKLSDARKAWMKSPEVLHNCSTGFNLPTEHDDLSQEYALPLKLLHFYHANVLG